MTKAKQLLALILVTLAALLSSGCSSPITGTAKYNADGKLVTDVDSHNLWLSTRAQITTIQARDDNGYLRAQAVIRNRWHFTLDYRYKFVWYDAEGMEIETDSAAWNMIRVNGKTEQTVSKLAPSPKATSFKIILRD